LGERIFGGQPRRFHVTYSPPSPAATPGQDLDGMLAKLDDDIQKTSPADVQRGVTNFMLGVVNDSESFSGAEAAANKLGEGIGKFFGFLVSDAGKEMLMAKYGIPEHMSAGEKLDSALAKLDHMLQVATPSMVQQGVTSFMLDMMTTCRPTSPQTVTAAKELGEGVGALFGFLKSHSLLPQSI